MAMISSDLQNKIRLYLETEISLSELEDWITPRLPRLARDLHSDDAEIVSSVELALAEWSDNIRTEPEVREFLSGELKKHTNVLVQYPLGFAPTTFFSSSNTPIEADYNGARTEVVWNLA
jgi:hypothetical protein